MRFGRVKDRLEFLIVVDEVVVESFESRQSLAGCVDLLVSFAPFQVSKPSCRVRVVRNIT